jgi:hypothetical protein
MTEKGKQKAKFNFNNVYNSGHKIRVEYFIGSISEFVMLVKKKET